jgi:hypothetical protein
MLETAYFGGPRVSELVSLTWSEVIRRDNGRRSLRSAIASLSVPSRRAGRINWLVC